MDNQIEVLDAEIYESNVTRKPIHLVSGMVRFVNFVIDNSIVLLLSAIIQASGLLGEFGYARNVFFSPNYILASLCYFVTSEYYFKKSIGKVVTRTMVVRRDGKDVRFWNIFIRTLCRHIPFEPLSCFGSNVVGWHDSLSNTHVVRDGFKKLF